MIVESATTTDGTPQLRRRWPVDNPAAAVLIVHGIGEHSGRYGHVGEFLAARGYDVAAYDNRGFGESGGRRGHVDSFSQYLDDIGERMVERGRLGVPTVLLGHSLGGLMGAAYMVDPVRAQPALAVLSSPALHAVVPGWQKVAAPVLGRLTPKLFVPSEIDGVGLSRDPAVQEAYAADPLLVAGATAGMGYEVFATMKEVGAKLHRITIPTYVFHGDEDPIVPQHASKPLEALDNVTYRTWVGLRHECMNEPEQHDVLNEIHLWLADQLAASR